MMDFLSPATWPEALATRAALPDAVPIRGGTEVMVKLTFRKVRPPALLDLSRVRELADWTTAHGRIRIGAGVTLRRLVTELADRLPALAMAARTIGSPQIRNQGTLGGNLGPLSRSGDTYPALLACDAVVELASVRGSRLVPAAEFGAGPVGSGLAPDELIAAIHVTPADGPQQFAKVGRRNAMAVGTCAFGLALRPRDRSVGAAINSAPTRPRRAAAAEDFLTAELGASGMWESRRPPAESVFARFGELVGAAVEPIDDRRGTAGYRRLALTVLASRALRWACQDYHEKRW